MFSSPKEAVAAADELIAQNRQKYPWLDGAEDIASTVNPGILSKFRFIHDEGIPPNLY